MRAVPQAVRRRLGPAAALLAAGVVAGCGGADGNSVRGAAVIGQDRLNNYKCADWNRADPAEQTAVVNTLRRFASGMVTGRGAQGRGARLEDDHAHRLFINVCRNGYAQYFVLYKLYTHAAAFAGR